MERVSFDRNIVQYYGACLNEEVPLLVMEYMAVRPSRARARVPGLFYSIQAQHSPHPELLASSKQPIIHERRPVAMQDHQHSQILR